MPNGPTQTGVPHRRLPLVNRGSPRRGLPPRLAISTHSTCSCCHNSLLLAPYSRSSSPDNPMYQSQTSPFFNRSTAWERAACPFPTLYQGVKVINSAIEGQLPLKQIARSSIVIHADGL